MKLFSSNLFSNTAGIRRQPCERSLTLNGFWRGALLSLALLASANLHAQSTTRQSIALKAGWNAIWLEVEPRGADGQPKPPEEVFTDNRIAIVAAYSPGSGRVEFVENPSERSFNREGWAVWYREDPAGRTTLRSTYGNRAYLVQSTADLQVDLTGAAQFHVHRWVPDAYSLSGFGLVRGSEPTFANFLLPAADRHPVRQILELDPATGNWKPVRPESRMTAGQAYWVYTQGNSTYQGPMRVDIAGAVELDYGAIGRDQEVLVYNETARDAAYRVERVNPSNGFELVHVQKNPATATEQIGVAVVGFDIPAVPPRQSVVRTFRLLRNWTDVPEKRQLYRVLVPSMGVYTWLPASGIRSDLAAAPGTGLNRAAAGLWVGDVVLNGVSRAVPTNRFPAVFGGAPVDPVLAGPRSRVILHVNASGKPTLLRQVTLMRTRAVEGQTPRSVLVVDPARIPFFEGVERRGGTLVGRRIETIFYDFPRTVLPPDPLPDNFDRTTLKEDYRSNLDLEGGVGAGQRCSTPEGVWVMDPWHRSNPFRHAFHPAHTAGHPVQRQMVFTFDPPDSEQARAVQDYGKDILIGDFREILHGLVRSAEEIQVAGRIVLRRISTTATLE